MRATPLILAASLGFALNAHAQTAPAVATTSGTLVVVPAYGEVKHVNDEATVTFSVEEQDKDRAAAQARVNQKMKQGTDIVRREDPRAELKTVNYYSYPVYPEVPENPPRPLANQPVRRIPIGWRVGQYLEVKTRNLDSLPKTAAAAQKVLAISNIDYHLSPELTRKLDDERIAATYRNLNERIVSIARAMGRNVSDAVIDTVDFEGSGHYAGGQGEGVAAPMAMMRGKRADSAEMPEPSFEPGETRLEMRVVGKVKFR
jgi:predicted secreted protein